MITDSGKYYVYLMSDRSVAYNVCIFSVSPGKLQTSSLHLQGIASLSYPIYAGKGALQNGTVGTLYTDSYANDILFITANKESHQAKTKLTALWR